jgi:hypothetical protein
MTVEKQYTLNTRVSLANMIHPLVNNLSEFTDSQLEDKAQELQRKYFKTNNPQLQVQIANILDIYKEELNTRRSIAAQKQREQMDSNGKDLDSLINVS